MNEAANFCAWPCKDPAAYAEANGLPPAPPAVRSPPRPIPGFPYDFQPKSTAGSSKRSPVMVRRGFQGKKLGLWGRNLIAPAYQIANHAGSLSNKTIDTDLVHAGVGYVEYDTHNLYGTSERPPAVLRLDESCLYMPFVIEAWPNPGYSDELCIPRGDASSPSDGAASGYHTQYLCRCRCPCRSLVSSRRPNIASCHCSP